MILFTSGFPIDWSVAGYFGLKIYEFMMLI